MAGEKKNSNYLTGREIRAIAKANKKEIQRLEAYKNRKAPESEFITRMKNPDNILEIENLHTYFFTEQGVVKAVGGVPAKVEAARDAGLQRVLIPKENDAETLHASGVEVECVSTLQEVLERLLLPCAVAEQENPPCSLPEHLPVAAQGERLLPAVTAGTDFP